MNGFRAELLTKILGLNGHFTAFPIESTFTDYNATPWQPRGSPGRHLRRLLRRRPGPRLRPRRLDRRIRARHGCGKSRKVDLLFKSAEQGGFDSWDESDGIAIGYRLAQTLGVGLGDQVQIINPDSGAMTPFGSTPQIKSYPVRTIFNLGMVEFDSLLCICR